MRKSLFVCLALIFVASCDDRPLIYEHNDAKSGLFVKAPNGNWVVEVSPNCDEKDAFACWRMVNMMTGGKIELQQTASKKTTVAEVVHEMHGFTLASQDRKNEGVTEVTEVTKPVFSAWTDSASFSWLYQLSPKDEVDKNYMACIRLATNQNKVYCFTAKSAAKYASSTGKDFGEFITNLGPILPKSQSNPPE